MKKTNPSFVRVGCAILVSLAITQNQPALAGWTALINGSSVGWVSVDVRSSTGVSNRVTTLNNQILPSAAMAPTTGYKTNGPLPSGASVSTYARVKSLTGGVLQKGIFGSNGDGANNPELEHRIPISPADCAALDSESKITQTQAEFNANGNSGTITVTAKGTAGTALWLRGFEFTGSMADVPIDDPATPLINESIEYLKVNGVAKFESLVVGPFEFGGTNGNSCPLIIPFTLTSSNLEHLVYASDGVALSLPMVIICPSNKVVNCNQSFSYDPVQFAGCGDLTVTYSPAPLAGPFPAGSFPVGVTPVTVTVADTNGNSTNCTFTVTVTDTTAPVVPALPTLTGECSVTVPQPSGATDNCGGTVTATTTDPLTYTTQGTFTVHWKFDDGHGNSTLADQTVIVDDVTPPVPPALPTLTGNCSTPVNLVAPTATDNCAGAITGTTTNSLVYSNPGTNTVYWTFNDGNGNTSTATQKVVVAGLTFHGFYPPISGTGGSCSSPLRTANLGNNLPVKFDTTCGGLSYTLGNPTLSIERSTESGNPCGALTTVGGGNFTPVNNEWHFNWDTSGQVKGNYKLTATLQDGSKQFVWIKLK